MKRIIMAIAMFLISIMACVSCSEDEPYSPDRVRYGTLEDGTNYIEYQNKKYFWESSFFYAEYVEDDFYLGTIGPKWPLIGYVGYSKEYYSYTNKNPYYFYTKQPMHYVYLREDYDFRADSYLIAGTDLKIIYLDAVNDSVNYRNSMIDLVIKRTEVHLYPEACPNLEMILDVFYKDGTWYVSNKHLDVYKPTQAFIDILIENEIITQDGEQ